MLHEMGILKLIILKFRERELEDCCSESAVNQSQALTFLAFKKIPNLYRQVNWHCRRRNKTFGS